MKKTSLRIVNFSELLRALIWSRAFKLEPKPAPALREAEDELSLGHVQKFGRLGPGLGLGSSRHPGLLQGLLSLYGHLTRKK